MAVSDRWHFADRDAAEKAGVTTKCTCGGRKPLYPTKDHGRGMRWQVRHRVGGRQVSESFATKTEADNHDVELRNQKRQGLTPIDRNAGLVLFKDYGAHVLTVRQYEQSSRRTNRGYLNNHLNPWFGEIPLARIDHSTVEGWKSWMRGRTCTLTGRPYSPNVIQSGYILLSTILKSALFDGKIQSNPCKNVAFPKPPKAPEIQVWESDVVDRLLAAVPDAHHTLLSLAAHCGHRQGEVFAVAIEDMLGDEIDITHQVRRIDGELKLVPCKHGSTRKAPLPDDVADAMRLHIARYPVITMGCECRRADHHGKTWRLLFHDRLPGYAVDDKGRPRGLGPRGRPLLSDQWNRRVWWPTLPAADLSPQDSGKTGMHMLRHYCASVWLAGGAPVLDVSRWLGHKSITVTETIYGHLFDSSAQRGRQIMAEVFAARRNRKLKLVQESG